MIAMTSVESRSKSFEGSATYINSGIAFSKGHIY